MKLDTEFIRLPLDFDAHRLQEEVLAIPEEQWRPHPQGNPGNSALPLIAVDGNPLDDSVSGLMAPTPCLLQCEYLQQVLASFDTVFGRSRLMRLDGNAEATLHVDTNYYWAERVRVHVPILTSPAIEFVCGDRSLHMPEGESWIFDAWRRHNVLNPTGDRRIHLVADTVGSAAFWQLVARGSRPFQDYPEAPAEVVTVAHRPGVKAALEIERCNFPDVMSPWELASLAHEMVLDGVAATGAAGSADDVRGFVATVEAFVHQWRAAWARFGSQVEGDPTYQGLLGGFNRALERYQGRLQVGNGSDAVEIARQMLVRPALNPALRSAAPAPADPPAPTPVTLAGEPARPPVRTSAPAAPAPAAATPAAAVGPAAAASPADAGRPPRRSRFDRPVFIVSPPRSGSSFLFETLALSPTVWTIGGESHLAIESVPGLHPAQRGWDSNRLGVADAQPAVVQRLEANFLADLRDRDGRAPDDDGPLRLLEKTPKNALRVPFLNAAFPDARFVFLQRDPRESLASMMAAWESGRFVTYPDLPSWDGSPWSLLLTPEWRRHQGSVEVADVVADQWRLATEILLNDLGKVTPERWAVVGYQHLVEDPQGEMERLCRFLDLEWDRELDGDLPLSRHTLTPPAPDKWREREAAVERALPKTADAARRSRELLARPTTQGTQLPGPVTAGQAKAAPPQGDSPYRSKSSATFAPILKQLGSTLLASTYQTGKLVAVRELDGTLNTHFRGMESPMGMAYQGGRLAVGTRSQIWEYHNVPAVTQRLQPPGRYDSCFVPRSTHYTGDIRVHDVAWVEDELWAVATRFSCLATLDDRHSFVPRWRPPFISSLAAEDRCHLNGMAVVDGRVRYVTALGVSDEPGGWRAHKADGGVIIDVDSGEVAVPGLSMPHSPRWYRNRLWVLESGQGTLAAVDLQSGRVETVAELPGFTRGLAFAGQLAFVGLSEVREATTFGGLPLTARLEERECGVWVVNIETGDIVAILRFEDLVQEIFDVTLLPGLAFPEFAEHDSDLANTAFVVPTEALV